MNEDKYEVLPISSWNGEDIPKAGSTIALVYGPDEQSSAILANGFSM